MGEPHQNAAAAGSDKSEHFFGTQSAFRRKRGRILAQRLHVVAGRLGRPVRVLDVGGRAEYWDNVGLDDVAQVQILNNDAIELEELKSDTLAGSKFSYVLGDARNLSDYADGSVDFVHSNSVIEHVGAWWDMQAMAREVCRVGAAGWIQTPAWEFPIEPHFRVPFMHWFGQPIRRKMLWFSKGARHNSFEEKRLHADRINLLSRSEVAVLFPNKALLVERFAGLPKSYVVTWGDQA